MKSLNIWGAVAAGMIAFCSPVFSASLYEIDHSHSSIGFAVKHLMVSTTKGKFNDYQGSIQFDPENLAESKIEVTVNAGSIDTDNEQRDNHLKSPDFFEVDKFPEISFKSKRIEKSGDIYSIVGDLTIKGVTQEIEIPVNISGPIMSPLGKQVIGISGETTINRQSFGVNWNKVMDNGGLVVDDFVKIQVEVEAAARL